MLTVTAGPFSFKGELETEKAPKTVAAFERLLPFHSKIIHVRWSGESAWIPLGDFDIGLDGKPENATSHPAPGQVLWYPGGLSETEILFPYGGTMFASIVGQLAGIVHFAKRFGDCRRMHRDGSSNLVGIDEVEH